MIGKARVARLFATTRPVSKENSSGINQDQQFVILVNRRRQVFPIRKPNHLASFAKIQKGRVAQESVDRKRFQFGLVSFNPSTIAQDLFNSWMRNDDKNGLKTEFKCRKTILDSFKAKNQSCPEQLSQRISTMVITKYGMSERIRNSTIKNEVVKTFLSILSSLSCRLSFFEESIGTAVCFCKTILDCLFKNKNIPRYAIEVVQRGKVVCKCRSIVRNKCNEMSESWIEAKMDEKMTIHRSTTTTVFGFHF